MKQRLTAKEEEIMNIFWKNGEMLIRDVLNHIPEPKPNYNTVATQIKFLEDKGFLTRKPVSNTYLYCPAISEKEYSGSTISTVVKNYYNNSYMSVVSQFVEEEKMDIEELKALIAEIENKQTTIIRNDEKDHNSFITYLVNGLQCTGQAADGHGPI